MDRTVKVWDALSGQERLILKGHARAVYSVCFSPDGNRLASASFDQTVKVWDAHEPTEELRQEQEAAGWLRFLIDKKRGKDEILAAIHKDQTISEPVRQLALKWATEISVPSR